MTAAVRLVAAVYAASMVLVVCGILPWLAIWKAVDVFLGVDMVRELTVGSVVVGVVLSPWLLVWVAPAVRVMEWVCPHVEGRP